MSLLERTPPALEEVADQLLTHYYDEVYEFQSGHRPGLVTLLPCDTADPVTAARRILSHLAAAGGCEVVAAAAG